MVMSQVWYDAICITTSAAIWFIGCKLKMHKLRLFIMYSGLSSLMFRFHRAAVGHQSVLFCNDLAAAFLLFAAILHSGNPPERVCGCGVGALMMVSWGLEWSGRGRMSECVHSVAHVSAVVALVCILQDILA